MNSVDLVVMMTAHLDTKSIVRLGMVWSSTHLKFGLMVLTTWLIDLLFPCGRDRSQPNNMDSCSDSS
jgi:hypothetical protein